jgi:serine/threonine-protein kinase
LDFGLAKAFAGEQAAPNLSNSPTLSDMATMQGVILGTAAFMSPEQARGKPVDKRADIWAYGCVLYEMLTGQAAFQGEDVTEILASVVKGGPNLELLPANLHPRVRVTITRCLQKDLNRRYQDIRDARYEIGQALADPGGASAQPATAMAPRVRPGAMVPWIAAAVVLTAIIAGLAGWKLKPSEPRPVTRFYYELPTDQQFSITSECNMAVSPDGKQFVYGTNKGLYLRSMDELDAKLIPGSGENPQRPFFSPDGKWVGYSTGTTGQLKKIATSAGAPVTLTSAPSLGPFNWGTDDPIVYSQPGRGIMRVSANGGTPEEIIKSPENGFIVHPQILPGGKSVLYTSGKLTGTLKVILQSLKTGERKELFEGAAARYLPTGHIVYALGNNLFAIQFEDRKSVV